MTTEKIDDEIFDLYDEYCHGRIDRRQFFERAAEVTVSLVAQLRRRTGSAVYGRAYCR